MVSILPLLIVAAKYGLSPAFSSFRTYVGPSGTLTGTPIIREDLISPQALSVKVASATITILIS
jgi:hypothetical protein